MYEYLLSHLNMIGGIASIVGTVFGLPALVLALVQLRRTKKAAEAAKMSASEALRRLSNVLDVASIEQICSRCHDLMHLIRAQNLNGSMTAAFELRSALAKFLKSDASMQLQEGSELGALFNDVRDVHDELEHTSTMKIKISSNDRNEMLMRIAKVHDKLSMLSAVVGKKAGE